MGTAIRQVHGQIHPRVTGDCRPEHDGRWIRGRRQRCIQILRNAYVKALNDPAVIDEARKGRMDIDPATGEELEKLVDEIFSSPPEVVERVKKILAN